MPPRVDDAQHDAIACALASRTVTVPPDGAADAVRDEIGEDLPDPDRVDVEDREVGRTSAVT